MLRYSHIQEFPCKSGAPGNIMDAVIALLAPREEFLTSLSSYRDQGEWSGSCKAIIQVWGSLWVPAQCLSAAQVRAWGPFSSWTPLGLVYVTSFKACSFSSLSVQEGNATGITLAGAETEQEKLI